ncbi:MAG: hypothetical protein IPK07_05870 [Deltaproteobacteria bacterium]|nr:hypothetical protein [Deltaproteobacteria bacterium]
MDHHRPLSAVDVLDRAAALYRANFALLFVLAFVSGAIYFVLQQLVWLASPIPAIPMPGTEPGLAAFGGVLASYAQSGSIGVVSWFLQLWSTAALVYAVSRRHVGLPVTFGEAIRNTLGRLPYLFVTQLVLTFFMMLTFVGLYAIAFAVGFSVVFGLGDGNAWAALGSAMGAAFGLALLLGGLVGILRFWVHSAAVIVEGLGIGDALARSRDLMRQVGKIPFGQRNDVRLTVVLTVVPLIGLAAASLVFLPMAASAIAAYVLHWVDFSNPEQLMQRVMAPVIAVQIAAGALLHPFSVAATVLFYYDLRYRTEGLDLEMRALRLRKPRAPRVARPVASAVPGPG